MIIVRCWKECLAQDRLRSQRTMFAISVDGQAPPTPPVHSPTPSECRTDSCTSLWRAHPDLIQGPADLHSSALATELCTHVWIWCQGTNVQGVHNRASFSWFTCTCTSLASDTLVGWLRCRPAKPMGSPRVGRIPPVSILHVCVLRVYTCGWRSYSA